MMSITLSIEVIMFVMLSRLWRTLDKFIGIFEKIVDIADGELDNTIKVNKLGHKASLADAEKALLKAK